MKIKISKNQWAFVGRKAGWTKINRSAANCDNLLNNNITEASDFLGQAEKILAATRLACYNDKFVQEQLGNIMLQCQQLNMSLLDCRKKT